MHPLSKAQIAHPKADEAFSEVPSEYTDFVDVFSPKFAIELLEHTRINNHAIKFVNDWQPPYGFIYSLESMELETLKTYIENNLVNDFSKSSKFPVRALIIFNKKPNGSLRLCVDYWGLNNLIIKNWYPLLFVGESLDWRGQAWCFT